MNHTFTWGLIGPGKIAHQFADAVHRLPVTQLGLVYGRDLAKAEAFATHWMREGARPRFTGDLQALLDPGYGRVPRLAALGAQVATGWSYSKRSELSIQGGRQFF